MKSIEDHLAFKMGQQFARTMRADLVQGGTHYDELHLWKWLKDVYPDELDTLIEGYKTQKSEPYLLLLDFIQTTRPDLYQQYVALKDLERAAHEPGLELVDILDNWGNPTGVKRWKKW
jgi:hypothetical protein